MSGKQLSARKPFRLAKAVERDGGAADQHTEDERQSTEAAENPTETAENPTETAENPTEATENPTETAENPTEAAENPTETAENPTEAAKKRTEAAEKRAEEYRLAIEKLKEEQQHCLAAEQRAEQRIKAAEQRIKAAEQRIKAAEKLIEEQQRRLAAEPLANNAAADEAIAPTPQKSGETISFDTSVNNSPNASSIPINVKVLEQEIFENIDTIWYDLDIYEALFHRHPQHSKAAKQVFAALSHLRSSSDNEEKWETWPLDTSEEKVRSWLQTMVCDIAQCCNADPSLPTITRQIVKPSKSLKSRSNTSYKPDCVVVDTTLGDVSHWNRIISSFELKSNANQNTPEAWIQGARYAYEVFSNQCNRRFVIQLTLCGSKMMVWLFDHSGMLGSKVIDVNADGEKFVSVLLGLLSLEPALLGFDTTITTLSDGIMAMDVVINGQQQRAILDHEIIHYTGIVTRGTICWAAHLEGQKPRTLVIKDAWQALEHQEGELLQRAKAAEIKNMPELLGAYTVQVNGKDDRIFDSIRNGINYMDGKSSTVNNNYSTVNNDYSTVNNDSSKKRQLVEISEQHRHAPADRVHRRMIWRDFGAKIAHTDSLNILLIGLSQCIKAHEELLGLGILHRDISTGNLLINEDHSNPDRLGLLIDLDHAADIKRIDPSRLAVQTGTVRFMSIHILSGENSLQHCFMDDLESFFWVLVWICLDPRSNMVYGLNLNTTDPTSLATHKRGFISLYFFEWSLKENFAPKYMPLIPCVLKLWRLVFPGGIEWDREKIDLQMYKKMRAVLEEEASQLAEKDKGAEEHSNEGTGEGERKRKRKGSRSITND